MECRRMGLFTALYIFGIYKNDLFSQTPKNTDNNASFEMSLAKYYIISDK